MVRIEEIPESIARQLPASCSSPARAVVEELDEAAGDASATAPPPTPTPTPEPAAPEPVVSFAAPAADSPGPGSGGGGDDDDAAEARLARDFLRVFATALGAPALRPLLHPACLATLGAGQPRIQGADAVDAALAQAFAVHPAWRQHHRFTAVDQQVLHGDAALLIAATDALQTVSATGAAASAALVQWVFGLAQCPSGPGGAPSYFVTNIFVYWVLR